MSKMFQWLHPGPTGRRDEGRERKDKEERDM
jgi:hypothetical protein